MSLTPATQPNRNTQVSWRCDPFIGGEYVRGEGPLLVVENPATEAVITTVRQTSLRQLDAAVTNSRQAFESGVWQDPELRRAVLSRLADLLEARSAEFASALVQEVGTPVALCQPLQLGGPISLLRYLVRKTDLARERIRMLGRDDRVPASESMIRYAPVGVAAGIGAYNYPLMFVISKACTALAAGCASVFLPSPQTPLATLLFGEVAAEAGIPPGILNIVVGGADIGVALSSHPGIDKVSFTGSVAVGRQVMIQAAQGIKGVVLELGGKSAAIVLPGADLAKVAMPLHSRYLRNSGQGCQSPTRHLVPRKQFDDFIDVSREAYAKIQIGDPWDPATLGGPLISKAHRARVEGYIERSKQEGGRVLLGGGRPPMERGWYHNPTLIGGVNNDSEIARNELFAPVAVAMPYDSVEEAIAIANASDFGLAAHLYGPLDLAKRTAERLSVGTIYINGGGQLRTDSVLMGWKHSGLGCEWGEEGVMEFLGVKHLQWTL
jgi:aldehyde dehydrogenase (NAD+)/betaine-aldehyde dehydrogenase